MSKFILPYSMILMLILGCQEQKNTSVETLNGIKPAQSASMADDFSDLKPKKEEDDKAGCSTEEEQAKKLMESKKPEEIKLQGGAEADCVVE